ncbi:hypothetical protein [Rhizobium binxianense]|uniref:hypothetical protein n=1 Tax=Rhizobium binxianense TaxID=3024242 RepID=UPI00235EB0F4|nr:hypothetical protein [Rhizobium sp. MJ37]MDC9834356.1 hypothetical protein [Rhizobium sp. MJ37]
MKRKLVVLSGVAVLLSLLALSLAMMAPVLVENAPPIHREITLSGILVEPTPDSVSKPTCTTIKNSDGKVIGVCSSSQSISRPCDLCKQLEKSSVAFNRPSRMTYHADTPIELALAPEKSGVDPVTKLSNDLEGDVRKLGNVPYAVRMQATLSGPDFEITPSGLQERTILPDRATRWAWNVRPIAYGPDRMLVLEISAILELEGEALPPADPIILRERIPVDVGFWDRAVHVSTSISAVHATVAGVGATLISAGAWIWLRVRRQRAEGDDKPAS